MPDTSRNKKTGRYRSIYDDNALYKVVADVARAADRDEPQSVSMRKWDDARAAAHHLSAPTARQIQTRLRLPWEEIKRIALDAQRRVEMIAAARNRQQSRKERKWTAAEIFYALRLVANELGNRTINMTEYDRTRAVVVARDKKRLRSNAILDRLLPTSQQILGSLEENETWSDRLAAVGLEAPRVARPEATAMTARQVVDLFADVFRARPRRSDLDWLREKFGLSVARHPDGVRWDDHVNDIAAAREREGLKTPTGFLSKAARAKATIPQDVLDGLPKRDAKGKHTYEACLDALVKYLDALGARGRPSQHHYQQLAPANGWPAVNAIQRHAQWSSMLNAARLMRETGEIVRLETLKEHEARREAAHAEDGIAIIAA